MPCSDLDWGKTRPLTAANDECSAVMWTLLPSNVAGRTKKSVTSTILLIAYCAGNTIGAQVFQDKDAPMYIPAIVICAVMYAAEFVLMVAWRFYCKSDPAGVPRDTNRSIDHRVDQWENRRRAALIADMGLTAEESLHQGRLNAESDMTDYENVHFKYSI